MENESKEMNEGRGYRVQWFFLMLATLLAIIGGIVVNALYDFMTTDLKWSSQSIAIISLIPFILLLDVFTYFFGNFEKYKSDSSESDLKLFGDYLKYRLRGKHNYMDSQV